MRLWEIFFRWEESCPWPMIHINLSCSFFFSVVKIGLGGWSPPHLGWNRPNKVCTCNHLRNRVISNQSIAQASDLLPPATSCEQTLQTNKRSGTSVCCYHLPLSATPVWLQQTTVHHLTCTAIFYHLTCERTSSSIYFSSAASGPSSINLPGSRSVLL